AAARRGPGLSMAEGRAASPSACGKGGISRSCPPAFARGPPLGGTYSHKPMFRHSSAGTWRPVRMISSARPWPTIRGNRTVPPSTHTPTAAIDAEIRPLRHHPEIAPQPQFHPAGDGRPLDGGDDRLVPLEPGGGGGPTRDFPAIAARPRGGDIELAQRIVGIERAHVFEIPARAKRAARAIENRDAGILVGIEFEKGGGQRVRACGVHGVAGFGPVVNHGPYRAILLNSDCHLGYPPHDEPLDKRLAGDDSKQVTGSSAPQSMGGRIA